MVAPQIHAPHHAENQLHTPLNDGAINKKQYHDSPR